MFWLISYLPFSRSDFSKCCILHAIKVWANILVKNKIPFVNKVVFSLVSSGLTFTIYPWPLGCGDWWYYSSLLELHSVMD